MGKKIRIKMIGIIIRISTMIGIKFRVLLLINCEFTENILLKEEKAMGNTNSLVNIFKVWYRNPVPYSKLNTINFIM